MQGTYTLDGFPLDDPAGRWWLRKGTGVRIRPARRSTTMTRPGRDGYAANTDARYMAGSVSLLIMVKGAAYEEMRDNLDLLMGILSQRRRLLPLTDTYTPGNAKVADVEITASIEPELIAHKAAELEVICSVPSAYWRDATLTEAVAAATSVKTTRTLYELAGGTGTISDAMLRFEGGFSQLTASCPNSGQSITVNEALLQDESILVDPNAWTASKQTIQPDTFIATNLSTNPSFESSDGTVDVWTNRITNPSFETASGSAEVWRNIGTNPQMEHSTGDGSVWENLAPNPSFETAVGTQEVRRNLTLNPTAALDTANAIPYSGGETVSRVTGIADTPVPGVTTGYRVTIPAGSGAPGIKFSTNVNGDGGPATVSYWVKRIAGDLAYAPAFFGLASGALVDMPINTWVHVSFSEVISETNPITPGFRGNSTAAADNTFDIMAVTTERRPETGPYFDGDTADGADLTHGWVSDPHSSASIQTAPGMGNYTADSTAIIYQSNTTLGAGAKSGAVDFRTIGGRFYNSSSIYAGAAVLPRTALMTIESTTAQTLQIIARDYDVEGIAGGSDEVEEHAFAAGERKTIRVERPGGGEAYFRLIVKCVAGDAGLAYVDDQLITSGHYVGPYFDGDTAAAGDFTYIWNGTPHNSVSAQRAPYPAGASEGTGAGGSQTVHQHAGTTARWTSQAGDKSTYRITHSKSFEAGRIVAGSTYTILAGFRLHGWAPQSLAVGMQAMDSTNDIMGVAQTEGAVGPDLYEYRRTFAALANADSTSGLYTALPLDAPAAENGMFDLEYFAIVPGTYEGPYFDGDTAAPDGDLAYVWVGEPQQSQSTLTGVGLPDWLHEGSSVVQSSERALSGSKSLRIIAKVATGPVYSAQFSLRGLWSDTDYVITVWSYTPDGAADPATNIRTGGDVVQPDNSPLRTETGQWIKHTKTFTTDAAGGVVAFYLYSSHTPGDDTWWDNWSLVEGSYVGEYFDGDTPAPDADMEYVWNGAPHAATSALRGTRPAVYRGSVSAVVQSTGWAASGQYSMRLIPQYDSRGSGYVDLLVGDEVEDGATYTVMATCRTTEDQLWGDGIAPGMRRAIFAIFTGGPYPDVVEEAPVEAGVNDLRITFTAPPEGAPGKYIRLYNGGKSGDPDVWWDNLAIIKHDYDGPYFDGYSGRTVDAYHAWDGAPHASTSTRSTGKWTGGTDVSPQVESSQGYGPMIELDPDFTTGAGRYRLTVDAVNPVDGPSVTVEARRAYI